jgi:phosphatidylserine/phosphatidylglycerophosphate/cardiolipin synthase-like enzyme
METVRDVEAVCFSRAERCDDLLTGLIRGAKDRIYVAIYSFTSDRLAEALIEARRRGVDVRVVMERREANVTGSEYPRLLGAGVDVRLDANPGLMHHKFMVIDGEIVVTGSYNWSAAAEERNDENLVVIRDKGVAGAFEREFERIWSQS